jgi:ABC-type multidrug transport system fused ATPase/permease subunit
MSNTNTEETKKKLTKDGIKKLLGIYRFVLPYKSDLIISLILLLISTSVFLIFPRSTGQLIDSGIIKDQAKINTIGKWLAFILVAQSIVSYIRIVLVNRLTERTISDIRIAIFNKLISVPYHFFEKNRVGELTSRISNDVSQLQETFSFTLMEFLRQIILLVVGVTYILIKNTELGLVMLSTFPITVGIAFYFGRRIKTYSKETQKVVAESNVIVDEAFQGIQTVKAYTGEYYESKRYANKISQYIDMALRAGKFRGALVSFVITGVFGGIVLVLWYGVSQVAKGHLTTGDFIEFAILMFTVGASIASLGDVYSRLVKTVGASETILEILGEDNELEIKEVKSSSVQNGNISFQNVSFAYPTRSDITTLKDINLDIKAGEKIALVGQSGSGKSTITRLLLRYYHTDNGVITVDNKNIKDYELGDLRKSIGIVPQEVLLFGGSIRENVLYGKPDATEKEIITACEQANALEFINQFPEGLDTLVGERGIQLSGGQKQRIAIARAVLKNPKILILDEATSSLDSQSEALVTDALEKLMQNRTTIVIAHRLSTIRKVDKIYVIKDGRIAEEGKHETLIAAEGIYHALLKAQYQNQETIASESKID